jgi:hypothetical protein
MQGSNGNSIQTNAPNGQNYGVIDPSSNATPADGYGDGNGIGGANISKGFRVEAFFTALISLLLAL